MIKLLEKQTSPDLSFVITAFADSKEDVGATGADTEIEGFTEKIGTGSLIFTAKREVAFLKSDDTWEWGDE